MPTYDYKCGACGHQFEHFQSMKDVPLRKCPKCAKSKLERLIGTGAAIIFKGSGFYQTDYRNESYKKAAEADKPASESKPDTKPDTKPETKADSAAPATPAGEAGSRPAPTESKAPAKSGGPKSGGESGTPKARKARAKS
ncbi:MAG: FmdB family zinc ribbon protein [Phycisphaerales bacterium]